MGLVIEDQGGRGARRVVLSPWLSWYVVKGLDRAGQVCDDTEYRDSVGFIHPRGVGASLVRAGPAGVIRSNLRHCAVGLGYS